MRADIHQPIFYQDDLVSVIVPIYNIGAWLTDCLESIRCQTYKNLDVILVDDGSTDNSGLICDEYCHRDTRFRVIHQENRGVPEARNAGLRQRRGKWIAFVDGDDFLNVSAIEILVSGAKQGYDVVMMSFSYVDESAHFNPDEKVSLITMEEISSEECIKSLFTAEREAFLVFIQAVTACKFYSDRVIDNLFFDNITPSEDKVYSSPVFQRVDTLLRIDAPLYAYRNRGGSITKGSLTAPLAIAMGMKKMLSYVHKHRAWLLLDLYTQMPLLRFQMKGTSYQQNMADLCADILRDTKREYYRCKLIPNRHKLFFFVFWGCPFFGLVYNKWTKSKGEFYRMTLLEG